MTARNPSAFLAWFREQYGKPSGHLSLTELRDRVRAADRMLWSAKLRLLERERYEMRLDACLKAWCARGGKP